MAVTNGQVAVGLTPQPVDGVSTNPYRLHIQSLDNTKKLYLGNASVTASTGFELVGTFTIDVSPNEQLYVVSDQTGNTVSWLRMDV